MKVVVNDAEVLSFSDIQEQIIKDYIPSEIYDEDMTRRIQWVLNTIYDEAFKQLKTTWDIKLQENGVTMIPTDQESYAKLVFSQPNYMDRSARIKKLEADSLAAKL